VGEFDGERDGEDEKVGRLWRALGGTGKGNGKGKEKGVVKKKPG